MKHKVLFVDDEPQLTDTLKRVLRKEPYDILTARSADEALALLARNSIDVVVSDEQMPGMPGSKFITLVRDKYPETIRMILTGHASLDAVIRAVNEGEIYRFFTKPCNPVDLAVTISQALERKALMIESRRLLQVVKHQSSVLQDLEDAHPGITKVKRDESGAVLIDDVDTDCETLLKEIEAQVKSCEDLLRE